MRPEELTKETALEFTKEFEISYIKDKKGGEDRSVGVGTFFVEQVKDVKDGFHVHLEYAYSVE